MQPGEIAEFLGNIGEFVGAIAVVATLIYLVREVRQSSELIRESNLRAQIDRSIGHSRFVAGTPGMMELYERGMDDPESLTREERSRFGTFLFALFLDFSETHYLHGKSKAADFYWENQRTNMLGYLKRPGGRDWWNRGGRKSLHPDFVAYVDSELAADSSS